MAAPAEAAPNPTLAEKIDRLFRTVRPPGKAEYSSREVADAVREMSGPNGPTISSQYVWQLRKGVRDNPTKKHLEGLASFFGVEPSYFFDEQGRASSADYLEVLHLTRDENLRSLVLRAAGLSSGSLQAIAAMVENFRRLEGLPSTARAAEAEDHAA